jgi:hypothetical protein
MSKQIKERLYNIIVRNNNTGKHVTMTAYPDTHAHCMTIISKIHNYAWRTIFIEEVTNV